MEPKPLPSFLRVRAPQGVERELAAFDPDLVLAFNTGEERWQVWAPGRVTGNWIRVLSWVGEQDECIEPDHRMIEVLYLARFDRAKNPQVYVRGKMAHEAAMERKRKKAAFADLRNLFKDENRLIVKDAEAVGTPHYQTREDRRLIMANFDRECEARGDGD